MSVVKAAAQGSTVRRFDSCQKYFFPFLCVQIFFAANLTYGLTHAFILRKKCKCSNVRNINTQSAHVANLRQYCAKKTVRNIIAKLAHAKDLNDVVAQSHSNNLGRSSKVRTTLLK